VDKLASKKGYRGPEKRASEGAFRSDVESLNPELSLGA